MVVVFDSQGGWGSASGFGSSGFFKFPFGLLYGRGIKQQDVLGPIDMCLFRDHEIDHACLPTASMVGPVLR